MRNQTKKADWRRAQSFSIAAFAAMGAILYGIWLLLDLIPVKGYREALEGAVLAASYLAIFAISPMTHYFYARLTRR